MQVEQPDKILKNLFTTGFAVREQGANTGKHVTLPNAKVKYAEHLLNRNWQEICGEHLANYCCVQKIKGSELTVSVANSLLANELFMMKSLFLQKVNGQLKGLANIKKVNFQVSSKINKYVAYEKIEDEEIAAPVAPKPCGKCGVMVQTGSDLCDVCTREEKNILKYKIAELLKVQPWLKFEDCRKYFSCDRILFNAVKDNLQNIYFERVRLNTADEFDCHMAVMFLTGKSPDEIDDKIFENSLAYLRRNQNVSTPWFRLHGKK